MLTKRFLHSFRDVVVVGGGPAGLSILTALKNSPKTSHLECSLIEGSHITKIKEFDDPNYTNRVISLTTKSIKFMQKIGNWNYIDQERIKFYDNLFVVDSQDKDANISFTNDSIDYNPMGAMCEILNVQKSLLLRLDDINSTTENKAEIIENVKVEDIVNPPLNEELDWPIIKLSNGDTIQTRLLIGADGYNSPVRKYAGIESRGWQYDSFGIVSTLTLTTEDFNNVGYQRFLSTGPLGVLPLTDNNATLVWSTKAWLSKILKSVDDDMFKVLVNAALRLDEVDLNYVYKKLEVDPKDTSVIDDINWRLEEMENKKEPSSFWDDDNEIPEVETLLPGSRAMFPLKMSHADTYVAPRVALVGDAAHTIHPLAGQGLNMGQTDVSILIETIEKGIDRGLDIGSTLTLEPYVSNAWPMNHAILGVCDKLHKLFGNDFTPIVAIRGLGMKVFNNLTPIKDMLVKSLSV
ncbi:ubiquinone biosynthesis monooxygenase Coq6p, mitochondrial [[Candida] jaroonii]|uniref:Ubiquinone biosynthesis monooxygenase Coq6p, mitochondrial n=1 Tax=[Candida] jaroonii TaxID=467808 RepID=A0ACA9Y2E7_9ASCO|nr:ubiquinone biosynthesis monooxygenase Coq6p, mitochondrial [[Candida] jaroonii]